jgi:hypothetical protein
LKSTWPPAATLTSQRNKFKNRVPTLLFSLPPSIFFDSARRNPWLKEGLITRLYWEATFIPLGGDTVCFAVLFLGYGGKISVECRFLIVIEITILF